MTHAAENLNLVLLDLHPTAAAVAPLTPLQVVIDLFDVYRHASRQTFDYRDQRASM